MNNDKNEFTDNEFTDEFGFDWQNIPMKLHPKNKKLKRCICPKCEYFYEQKKYIINNNIDSYGISLCPDHYDEFMNQLERSSFLRKCLVKFAIKINAVVVKKLTHMQSDLCVLCKFGGGKKQEIII